MAFGKKKVQQRVTENVTIQQPKNVTIQQHISSDEDNEEVEAETTENETPTKSTPISNRPSKDKPLLEEVTVLGAAQCQNGGGAKSWRCNHCKLQFTSTYTRIHNHFFGSEPGKKANIQRCKTLMSDRETYQRLRKKVQNAEGTGVVSQRLKHSTINKKQIVMPNKSPLEVAFGTMEREVVNMKVMRFLCANAIAFNVLRSPQWHEMVHAINNAPKGYKSLSYEKARTSGLDECKSLVEKEMAPVKDTWYTHGVSIVSDGWANCKQDQLINVIATNFCGAMFMYSGVFNGVEKTGKLIAGFLLSAIEEIGPSNVLSVVTDNAKNCIAAGREIEKVHKHIFWSPCVCHTLNLVFKDFAESLHWINDTYKCGKQIVKFFRGHNYLLALFKENSTRILLKVAKTRFGSH